MFGQNPSTVFASTVSELLEKARQLTEKYGHVSAFTTTPSKNIHGATLVLNIDENTAEKGRYPYWDSASENWYLKTFVATKIPPELTTTPDIVFPYTYGWRSLFYDEGWGQIVQTLNLLREHGYSELNFSQSESLAELITQTYTSIHPNVILSVLAWQGETILQSLLTNPSLSETLLSTHRTNTIKHITDHLQEHPTSSHGITPSFTYGAFDHVHMTTHAPAYQTFQALVSTDPHSNSLILETIHHQKSMYADGSGQLDIAHDLLWGRFLSERTGIPHTKITILVNELIYVTSKEKSQQLIENALIAGVNAYRPLDFDVKEYVKSTAFRNKAQITLDAFSHT